MRPKVEGSILSQGKKGKEGGVTCLCDRSTGGRGRLERAAGILQCLVAMVHTPESISSVLYVI